MKTFLKILFAVALAYPCMTMAPAVAEDVEVVVPTSVEQIGDPALRSALEAYSPNYDSLSRDEQIAAYDYAYEEVFGVLPYASQTVVVPAPMENVYDPALYPGYAYPGYGYPGIDGWEGPMYHDGWERDHGWRRPSSHHNPPPPHYGESPRHGGPPHHNAPPHFRGSPPHHAGAPSHGGPPPGFGGGHSGNFPMEGGHGGGGHMGGGHRGGGGHR